MMNPYGVALPLASLLPASLPHGVMGAHPRAPQTQAWTEEDPGENYRGQGPTIPAGQYGKPGAPTRLSALMPINPQGQRPNVGHVALSTAPGASGHDTGQGRNAMVRQPAPAPSGTVKQPTAFRPEPAPAPVKNLTGHQDVILNR